MIFNFTISGKEDQIVEFEKELLEILIRLVDDQEMEAHEIHFCIHEAIMNILQHSYKWNLDMPIEVRLDITGNKDTDFRILEIKIKDIGPVITKTIVPPKNVDKFQMRQRGLYMISKIMDEFYIKPQKKTGNITFMKKVLHHSKDEAVEIAK